MDIVIATFINPISQAQRGRVKVTLIQCQNFQVRIVPTEPSSKVWDTIQPKDKILITEENWRDCPPLEGVVTDVSPQMLWATLPDSFDNLMRQRRLHLRVLASFPVKVELTEDPFTDRVVSVDISGGGMRIRSTRPYELGSLVKLQFTLPHSPQPMVLSGVVRKVIPLIHTNHFFDVAIQFANLPTRLEDQLVGFCFRQETHQKKHLKD